MPKLKTLPAQPKLPQLEEEILKFWEETHAFEKSVSMRPANQSYVFYDGPPFATGLPHYGHIVASTMKDIIPRYWTMQGKRVERKWGWDCHGLPIENIAEKELGIKQKKQIYEMGVDKFNETCRSKVLSYVDDWKKIITRLGRWADMENDYKTMDIEFMESVWWTFQQLYDKGLVYEDHRSMHICPRCETTLSQSEVTEGYKDVKDISITAEFEVKNPQALKAVADKLTDKTLYLLAWTTTPWTLPGNFLLAANADLKYVVFIPQGGQASQEEDKAFICAKERLANVVGDSDHKILATVSGKDLTALTYQPLFPYYQDTENAFRVVNAEFVSAEDGTGIVHIAPGFGEDDYKVGQAENVKLIQHVGLDGRFTEEVIDFAGMEVKPKDNPQSTDIEIIRYLAKKDLIWSKQKITHSYPHCWRCDTPLLNYATSSYFVNVTKIKNRMLELAKDINWSPGHIKYGRWGNWLEGAKDWSISRQRFWASVIPLWKCECGHEKVYGSVAELEKDSGKKITDLHKHIVDEITVPCEKCGKTMHRIPDVLDTWFDSGSMPYGQAHYPFENKSEFEKNFPAEFIGEGVDQTRAWFYYLHVIATGVKDTNAYKNVLVNGIVLAEDGKKMSKRLQNYPDPALLIDKYGSDSLRLYLASSPVLKAENLNFSEKEVAQLNRKVFIIWWNVLRMYLENKTTNHDVTQTPASDNVMDRWILSKLNHLNQEVTQYMNEYDLVRASRALIEFMSDLSNWYVRLSRERFKDQTQTAANHVLGHVLYTLAQLFAPFTPFFADLVHHQLIDDKTSIHHTDWPEVNQDLLHPNLEAKMVEIRKAVEKIHAQRKQLGLKVRQPLAKVTIASPIDKPWDNALTILAQEANLKEVIWQKGDELTIELDTELTPELKAEGEAREVMRNIQKLRKKEQLNPEDVVTVELPEWPTQWQAQIEEHTNTRLAKGQKLQLKK
jgi:isoleucyl-tRNA synthetase